MSSSSRRRGRRRTSNAGAPAIRQLPKRVVNHRFPPVEPLDAEQLEFIHETSLDILENDGIEVMGARALRVLRDAGAEVSDDGLVRMDRGLVLEAVAKAPAEFDVVPRNPEQTLHAGGRALHFGLVSGPPNVHDHVNGRRAGNIEDYRKLISFGQFFNVITFFGNQATPPTDLPANSRHLDTILVNLTLSDKAFFTTGIGAGRCRDAIEMVAIAQGIGVEELKRQPSVMTNINVNSPRRLDDTMVYGAMQMSLFGQAVAVTPFTLMGAMTPATMAGALAQQNAEALFGIALLQLTRPGTPVIYGAFTSNVDMRSGSPAFGTPENCLANIAAGQLARRYRLPYRTSACNSANVADAQATYETQMALWGALLGHGNFVYHAAGWLEGGLLASFEKIIIDCEMLQQMTALVEPLKIDASEAGVEAMREVGPGGHFFGCEHTRERYKSAFYEPFLSNWQNYENWKLAGSMNTTQRATEIWQKILADFSAPPIDAGIEEELNRFVAIRKEALGREEPALEPVEE